MCGIFGIIQPTALQADEVRSMSRLLRHRGPDDEGFLFASPDGLTVFGGEDTPEAAYRALVPFAPRSALTPGWSSMDGGLVLGHRRLSIVDLSPQGHQPMSYRDRYWIVFNGEVYNYVELRVELLGLGHHFVSESDTEVILAAYAEWGPACLSRFNGMWGLAIFDRQEKTLFLARDRFGVKPLYYRITNGRFAFASEIKAFSALSDWKARINDARLLDYLVWNIMDHTNQTFFEGVEQLPAGHFLLISIQDALYRAKRGEPTRAVPVRWYWLQRTFLPRDISDATEELRVLLCDSVRLRLRADVQVGSCLSGGLDSSGIVCVMRSELTRVGVSGNLRTFTSQSSDAQFDESRYAQAVVQATNADAVFVNPTSEDLFAELDQLLWAQDEPVLSASNIAQRHVFRAARRAGVTVMLDGQGADEILGGYRGFFGAYLGGLARRGAWWQWWRETSAMHREIGFSRWRSSGYTAAYLWPGVRGLLGRFDARAVDRDWIGTRYKDLSKTDPLIVLGGRACSVREMSLAQLSATNLPMLLHWEDRNSMAFSIEARVPFLDYRLVEFCLDLSEEEKVGGGVSKSILRRSLRGLVPDLVLDRRDKMGFLTAEPLWMKRDQPKRFRQELVAAQESLAGVVSPLIVDRFDEVVANRRAYDPRYWRVICAGRWQRAFNAAV